MGVGCCRYCIDYVVAEDFWSMIDLGYCLWANSNKNLAVLNATISKIMIVGGERWKYGDIALGYIFGKSLLYPSK